MDRGIVVFLSSVCALTFGQQRGLSPCQDSIQNCKDYGKSVCEDPQYYTWATHTCPKYCEFCTGTQAGVGKIMDGSATAATCTDAINNCQEYGTKICDDVIFYSWVEDNCRQYCNRCTQTCEDTLSNCDAYGADLCTNFQYNNWVELHCRKYCGRCHGTESHTTSGPMWQIP